MQSAASALAAEGCVAQRLVPTYIELGEQLSNSDHLAGDDTSCRVLEVASWLEKVRDDPDAVKSQGPPWSSYATPSIAEQSLRRCQELREVRNRRREDGDRAAVPTSEETPSLGMLIDKGFVFEPMRRNGDGPKEAMHTTVVTGRSVAADPRSLIVFYRSHLGSCGNLLESLLKSRGEEHRDLVLQGDLSTTNLVTSEKLLERLNIRAICCAAHARRPFALYEDKRTGDVRRDAAPTHRPGHPRGPARRVWPQQRERPPLRGAESRELWNDILELAKNMANRWSMATNLGAGARYIISHFEALTAYLDDPRLEASNNKRERMLRTEKLIEGSSMFRRSLERRFAADVMRTILQTAVAAGAPAHGYLVSMLRASEDDVDEHLTVSRRAHGQRWTPAPPE